MPQPLVSFLASFSQQPPQVAAARHAATRCCDQHETSSLQFNGRTDALTGKPAAVRFGNGALVSKVLELPGLAWWTRKTENTLTDVFKLVIESFFMNLMAIDVVALWIPRIRNALFQGAYKYNPDKDPKIEGKTGWARKLHIWREKFKRLNWVNAMEESWREFASGPAIFTWPTILFLVARGILGERSAIQLSNPTLKTHSNRFAQFLDAHPPAEHTAQAAQNSLKGFLTELLGNPEMRQSSIPVSSLLENLPSSLHEKYAGKSLTYGEALARWSEDFSKLLADNNNLGWFDISKKHQYYSQLKALEGELSQLTQTYNAFYQPQTQFYGYNHLPLHVPADLENQQKTAKAILEGYLTPWHERVNDMLAHATRQDQRSHMANLGALSQELTNWKQWLENAGKANFEHSEALGNQFASSIQVVQDTLNRLEKDAFSDYKALNTSFVRMQEKLGGLLPKHAEADKLFGELLRWKDFAFKLFAEKAHHTGSYTDLAETMLKKFRVKKMLWGGATTIITLLFLFRLVKWTQSHNDYPALRQMSKKKKKHHLSMQQLNPVNWPKPSLQWPVTFQQPFQQPVAFQAPSGLQLATGFSQQPVAFQPGGGQQLAGFQGPFSTANPFMGNWAQPAIAPMPFMPAANPGGMIS